MGEAFDAYRKEYDAAALHASLQALIAEMEKQPAPEIRDEDFVYVAMGASLSLGAGASPGSRGWVYEVGRRLAARIPNVRVRNLAAGGKTTEHAREVQLPEALNLQPDLVTYTAGLNDLQYGVSAEEAKSNTAQVLKALRERTPARIVLTQMSVGSNLPIFSANIPKLEARRDNLSPERVAAFNAAYTELAAEYGAVLVDIGDVIAPGMTADEVDALFSYDGVHLNNEGHARAAAIFWQAIEPLFLPSSQ